MDDITLIYIPSHKIVEYITQHPIAWMEDKKDFAQRGGWGDRAGVPPTPSVEEFLRLLILKQGLFTQREYFSHCFKQWRPWIEDLGSIKTEPGMNKRVGLKAKLYRNFYPSMIDSLHVWAMLSETGKFDSCVMSSTLDAVSKTDLIVRNGCDSIPIAIIGPTRRAANDRAFKVENRNGEEGGACITLQMDLRWERQPGNKRWFTLDSVIDAISEFIV